MDFPIAPLEFVKWLGTAAAAGFVVSYWFERQAWFQALTAQQKEVVVFWTFIILPLASHGVGLWLGTVTGVPVTPQEWVTLLIGLVLQGLAAWGASQYAHGSDPARE